MFSLGELEHPIVQAPLGGGPGGVPLAAAVSQAGGLGFLAAGYKRPDAVREEIRALRERTKRPFGVGVFAPPGPVNNGAAVERYAESLDPEVERYGTELGAPRHDDDHYDAKVALMTEERVPVVSFTFGCPPAEVVTRLQAAGCAVWITVTTRAEAVFAHTTGADALVVQGVEAGGHRGTFDDSRPGDVGLIALLQLVSAAVDTPLVAAGGIATGHGVAAALAAGAVAAQVGTAFMLTPEAGTSEPHRAALAGDCPTALTRAFTGRTARGIANRFMEEHEADAPAVYPAVHNMTSPLRVAARDRGDAGGMHLWAGQAHALAEEIPAGELVRRLVSEAREALEDAVSRLR